MKSSFLDNPTYENEDRYLYVGILFLSPGDSLHKNFGGSSRKEKVNRLQLGRFWGICCIDDVGTRGNILDLLLRHILCERILGKGGSTSECHQSRKLDKSLVHQNRFPTGAPCVWFLQSLHFYLQVLAEKQIALQSPCSWLVPEKPLHHLPLR